jgi:hypothetical protein
MIEILKKIFKDKPENSTIELNGKYSDCGWATLLESLISTEKYLGKRSTSAYS